MSLKGINIQIGAETTGLDRALSDVNSRVRETQIELRQVEKLLKLDPKNAVLLAQKQKLLANSVGATKDKLAALKAAQAQVEAQFRRGDIGEKQYRAFQRELVKTQTELKRTEAVGTRASSGLIAGAKELGTQFGVAAGVVLSTAYAVGALVVEYAKAQVSETRLRTAVIANIGTWSQYKDTLESVIAVGLQKGFDDELQMEALTRLIVGTKDITEAERLHGLAMNISRGTGMDLVAVAKILTKVKLGNVGAFTKAGIAIDKNASATEALAEVERRYAGQADAASADAQARVDRLTVAVDNLREAVGKAFASDTTLADNANTFAAWLNYISDTSNETAKRLYHQSQEIGRLNLALKQGRITTGEYNAKMAAAGVAIRDASGNAAELARDQAAVADATDEATEAWQEQQLVLTPTKKTQRSLISQVLEMKNAQKALGDYLKSGGKESGAQYYDLLLKSKDAQALVAQTAATMTDKQVNAAVKTGVLSKKQGELAKKANDAAGKVDKVKDSVDKLPTGKTVNVGVRVTGSGSLRFTMDGTVKLFPFLVKNALGGVYDRATPILVGETGEKEYVINSARLRRGDARQRELLLGLLRSSVVNPRRYLDGMSGVTNNTTSSESSVTNIHVSIPGMIVREEADIDRIAERVAEKADMARRKVGGR